MNNALKIVPFLCLRILHVLLVLKVRDGTLHQENVSKKSFLILIHAAHTNYVLMVDFLTIRLTVVVHANLDNTSMKNIKLVFTVLMQSLSWILHLTV